MPPTNDQIAGAVAKGVAFILSVIDKAAAKLPGEAAPAVEALKGEIVKDAAVVSAEFVGGIFVDIGEALKNGDWGEPASDLSDLA